MYKIYNTQDDFATNIKLFLISIIPDIRKTVLNILPYILIGIINSESLVASDISKHLKGNFSLVQHDSVIKRIRRFFKNKLFNPYDFYDKIIRFVISSYKPKHYDKRVHIIFDHMFSKNNYTVFMISMRIGTQGIPLWFRCFNGNFQSDSCSEDLLMQGISYVSSLFPSDYNLIFLADRWFNSTSLLKFIDSLGHTYCIRLKRNIKILIFDKHENHFVWKFLSSIPSYKYHSSIFNNIAISDNDFFSNLVIGKYQNTKDPWIIVTNGDPRFAIKDYSYRFGGIETIFKNQKSNGFYLESTVNASLKYFTTEYMMACFATLYLTILGAEYSKNSNCYKHVKITTHKSGIRVLSLFNTGLTLFNRTFNSLVYIRIPFRFILYDI